MNIILCVLQVYVYSRAHINKARATLLRHVSCALYVSPAFARSSSTPFCRCIIVLLCLRKMPDNGTLWNNNAHRIHLLLFNMLPASRRATPPLFMNNMNLALLYRLLQNYFFVSAFKLDNLILSANVPTYPSVNNDKQETNLLLPRPIPILLVVCKVIYWVISFCCVISQISLLMTLNRTKCVDLIFSK
jgi:hypothetical protein